MIQGNVSMEMGARDVGLLLPDNLYAAFPSTVS